MIKKIKQFRYYTDNNTNNIPSKAVKSFFSNEVSFENYMPIVHLGIQTLPGTQVVLNANADAPIIVGASGIYELDLDKTTGLINSMHVDSNSMQIIENVPGGYLLMDIIYETEED